MNPGTYTAIFLLLFIVIYQQNMNRRIALKKIISKNKKLRKKERLLMTEMVKRFIGKECIIYTANSSQITGTVKEVSDGAILIDNGKNTEMLNADYVVRIREYPKGKNGKKKSVVLD